MDAFVLSPLSTLGLPSIPKRKLGTKPISPLKEIADWPALFTSRRSHIQLTISSIRADGNRRGRPPRKDSVTGRSAEDDGNNIIPQPSPDGKASNSANQEEIIALFRRIQSSISKGESTNSKRRSSKSSEEKPSAETVLDVLLQSRNQVKVEKTSNKEGDKALRRRRGPSKKVEKIEYPSGDFKLSRPPSNFVKRSPIPSPSSTTDDDDEELGVVKVEEMKLPALKELAKSRGLKGYSKLKKSELVELLRS